MPAVDVDKASRALGGAAKALPAKLTATGQPHARQPGWRSVLTMGLGVGEAAGPKGVKAACT